MEFKAGDIIRPAIIGRGIRSYQVLKVNDDSTLMVKKWNATTKKVYGDVIDSLDINKKNVWTLIRRLEHGWYCPDIRGCARRSDPAQRLPER